MYRERERQSVLIENQRNRKSYKINCPFRVEIRRKISGSTVLARTCIYHNHAPSLTDHEEIIAKPAFLTHEQRRELEELRVAGTKTNVIESRALEMLRAIYPERQLLVRM